MNTDKSVSILIRKDIPQQQINFDSEQVIAVKTTLHKPVNICSIYILPHDPINNKKLKLMLLSTNSKKLP